MNLIAALLIPLAGAIATTNSDSKKMTADSVFKKSADVMTHAKNLRYQAHYEGTDWVAAFVPTMEGQVTLGKKSKYEVDTFKCKLNVTRPKEDQPIAVEAGCDGDQYYLVDAKTKTVHRDMDPAVLGKYGRDVRRVVLGEFGKPTPFDEDHEGKTVELIGERTIIDEPCYEIHIKGGDSPDTVWFISTRDFIPRRYVRIHKNEHDEPGSTQLTLHAIEIDPKLPPRTFEPVTPDGYRMTDDFAD